MTTRIAIGDARKKIKTCRSDFINCGVASPPYWMLRDYGAGPGEIGREGTMQQYIDNLMEVIDEMYRVLTPHGTFWLNLGDSYSDREETVDDGGLTAKSLRLLPYRIAIAMEDRGWIIRNVIIWWKPNAMPESADDRFTVDFEPVFLCAKSPNYYFKQQLQEYSEATLKRCKRFIENGEAFDPLRHKCDPDRPAQAPMRILERTMSGIAKNQGVPGRTTHSMHLDRANGYDQDVFDPGGANMRCVWPLATARYRGAHFAVMPEKLVALCIAAGCPPGGRVLDPFLGSGTTGVVAERMGCDFYGIELNPEYAQHAKERILGARAKRVRKIASASRQDEQSVVAGLIVGDELAHDNMVSVPQESLP